MHHCSHDDLLDNYYRDLRAEPLLLDRERLDDLPLDAVRAYAQRCGSWRPGHPTSGRPVRFARSPRGHRLPGRRSAGSKSRATSGACRRVRGLGHE